MTTNREVFEHPTAVISAPTSSNCGKSAEAVIDGFRYEAILNKDGSGMEGLAWCKGPA